MAVKEDGAEAEYESDPEDALRPSAMRRREASDDEDGELSDGERHPVRRGDPRASDGESEGQGGAPADEDEDEEEFDAEEEEDLEEEAEGELEDEAELEEPGREEGRDGAAPEESAIVAESGGDDQWVTGEPVESLGDNPVEEVEEEEEEEEEEEKKENKPYAVPTAGAFYMHDDRFRENGRGRRRRLPDARKLWESKDDRAWVHDRFEEMNLQDARYAEERRTTKGRFRGRGNIRAWGTDHGHVRGNKLRPYDDNNHQNNRSRAYDDSNNQNRTPRSVRGRGPRRYEPLTKNISATQNKQYTKSHEPASSISAGRQSSQSSSMQSDPVLPRKHGFASNLNSASPPFYPSGSSNKEISGTQKRDTKNGFTSKTSSSPMQMGESFSTSPSSSLLRAKAIVGHDKGYRDDYIRPVAGKSLASSQLQSSESSLSFSSPSQSHSRFQGRDINITRPMSHQPITSVSQSTRASAQTQTLIVQQKQVQTPVQAVLQISTQQMGQRLGSGTQSSSPSQAPSVNSSDGGEARSPPGGSRSSTPSVGKGKIANQAGSGSGSFLYSGAAQILGATGAMGLSHGDQRFPATPALLPVMQFGGQHHGGLGFPAVGMALPGYVAQPQHGFGNSEMTWVPMLAGAAGALGASYCSPYMALDSSFYAHNSGQTSSSASSSRETGLAKPANTSKSPQEPETVNDEYGQRQNKPRRYSEMNFGQ